MGDAEVRFSDAALQRFYEEFREHREQEEKQRSEDREALLANTEAIHKVHASVQGLVEAWNAAEGFIKVMAVVGRAVKWTALVVAPIVAAALWLSKKVGG